MYRKVLVAIVCCVYVLMPMVSFSQNVTHLKRHGNVFIVPCKIMEISVDAIFDTGANDVLLSYNMALEMMNKGLITRADFIGRENYQIASGEIVEGMVVNLPYIEIGGVHILNIRASIVNSIDAPILLGGSAIERLGNISIDYNQDLLIIGSELPVSAYNQNNNELVNRISSPKFIWGVSNRKIEQEETLRKHEIATPLVKRNWKSVSPYDKSVSLRYMGQWMKYHFAIIYTCGDDGLRSIMLMPLNRGLSDGNPDYECDEMPSKLAFALYQEIDSLISVGSDGTFNECQGKSYYQCGENGYSTGSYFGYFSKMEAAAVVVDDYDKTMNHVVLCDMVSLSERTHSYDDEIDPLFVVRRRVNRTNKTEYDLCLSIEERTRWKVWLVMRKLE